MQVLAQQTSLDPGLTGSDVKKAVQKSGLFLEASLASKVALPATGIPDLKAALIVLRQTLLSSLGAGDSPAAPAAVVKQPVLPGTPSASATDAAAPLQAAATATLAPLSPEIDVHEILLPQARVPVADDSLESGNPVRIVLAETLVNAGPRAAPVGVTLNLLQEVLQDIPREIGNTSWHGRR
jgi:hypothetical protein